MVDWPWAFREEELSCPEEGMSDFSMELIIN